MLALWRPIEAGWRWGVGPWDREWGVTVAVLLCPCGTGVCVWET